MRPRFVVNCVIGIALPAIYITLVFTQYRFPPRQTDKIACMNNLRKIGALLEVRGQEGRLLALPGSRFLLQVAEDLPDDELTVFLCPCDPRYGELRDAPGEDFIRKYREDWRSAPCSYRGPDQALLAKIITRGSRQNPDFPIACDMNGAGGDQPHHRYGIVVLCISRKVHFREFTDLARDPDAELVVVGPDSPLPELRHLVP